jgi:WD40 repeat protein
MFSTSSPVLTAAASPAAFSPDGKRVIFRTQADSILHIGDIASGQDVFQLQLTGKAALMSFRYSPDGKRIFTGDTWGGIHIWDAANGRLLRSRQYHRTGIVRFDYSKDLRFYASVSTDGTVQVWDAATDEPVGALLEQSGAAARADFSPDNTRIITPSSAGSARVWDVTTGLPLTDPLNTEGDAARVVAFSPDGRYVDVHDFATNPHQFVRIWSVPPSKPGVAVPDWLMKLATMCGGHRLTDEGKLVDATESLGKIDEVHRALAAAVADDAYAHWGRWILSENPNRSIAPQFVVTPAEAAGLRGNWLSETPARAPASN